MLISSAASAEVNLQMFTFDIGTTFQIGAGQNLTITYVVRNEGSTESPATVMRVYYSSDATIHTNDTVLEEVNIDSLPPNGMTPSAQLTVTIPKDAPAGPHWVGGIVDPEKVVTETIRTDNTKGSSFTVMPPADLRVSMDDPVPDSQQFGGPIKVTFRVMKDGDAAAGPFKVRLYFSEDRDIATDDMPIDFEYETSLGAGITGDQQQIADVLLPSTATIGNHFVGAIVDPDDEIYEGTGTSPDPEGNNSRAVPIEITEAICYGILASDGSVCSGQGACVGPDKCECFDNWGGEQCDTPLHADDNITDAGSEPDAVMVEDTADPDIGQPDTGFDSAVPDQGQVVDTGVHDATADATPIEDDSDTDDGGCGQSNPAPLAPLIVAVFVAFIAIARRRVA